MKIGEFYMKMQDFDQVFKILNYIKERWDKIVNKNQKIVAFINLF